MEPDQDVSKPPGQPRPHPTVPAGQNWQDPRDIDQWFFPFTNRKTKACSGDKTCPRSQGVSGRAKLESRPSTSQLSVQYLLLPTKELSWDRGRGYLNMFGPQVHGNIPWYTYIIKIATIKS